jgi:hypothetical protein
MNSELFKQIDGVAKGSPLGPTLANIIMTTFEDEIVRQLYASPRKTVGYPNHSTSLQLVSPSNPVYIRRFP